MGVVVTQVEGEGKPMMQVLADRAAVYMLVMRSLKELISFCIHANFRTFGYVVAGIYIIFTFISV